MLTLLLFWYWTVCISHDRTGRNKSVKTIHGIVVMELQCITQSSILYFFYKKAVRVLKLIPNILWRITDDKLVLTDSSYWTWDLYLMRIKWTTKEGISGSCRRLSVPEEEFRSVLRRHFKVKKEYHDNENLLTVHSEYLGAAHTVSSSLLKGAVYLDKTFSPRCGKSVRQWLDCVCILEV